MDWNLVKWEEAPDDVEKVRGWLNKRFAWSQEKGSEAKAFAGKRLRLPFFDRTVFLYAMQLVNPRRYASPARQAFVLELHEDTPKDEDRFLMDGTGPPISEFVKHAGGLKTTQVANSTGQGEAAGVYSLVRQYLSFFCAMMLADEGNFVIGSKFADVQVQDDAGHEFFKELDSELSRIADDNSSFAAALEQAKADTDKAIANCRRAAGVADEDPYPIVVRAQAEGAFECNAIVFYAGASFEAKFKINQADGQVEMQDDKSIANFRRFGVTFKLAQREIIDGCTFYREPEAKRALSVDTAIDELRKTRTLRHVVVTETLEFKKLLAPQPLIATESHERDGHPLNLENSERSAFPSVRLEDVFIKGGIDLDGLWIPGDMSFRNCVVLGRLTAIGTKFVGSLALEKSEVWGLAEATTYFSPSGIRKHRPPVVDLTRINVDGSLELRRTQVHGSLRGFQARVQRHLDLRGIWLHPLYKLVGEHNAGADGRFLVRVCDPSASLYFEQAQIGGAVDLGTDVVSSPSLAPEKARGSFVVGDVRFDDARVEQSFGFAGLNVCSLRKESVDEKHAPQFGSSFVQLPTGLSLMGADVGGPLWNRTSITDWQEAVVRDQPYWESIPRTLIRGDLDLTFATIKGAVAVLGATIVGNLEMGGSSCKWLALRPPPADSVSGKADTSSHCDRFPVELKDHLEYGDSGRFPDMQHGGLIYRFFRNGPSRLFAEA